MDLYTGLFPQTPREAAIDVLHAATAIYTCDPVVDQLLARVQWPRGNRTLIDTSCGDGAFLRRALARLLASEPDLSDEELCQRITGWEIHPFAADQARSSVAQVLRDHGISQERAARCAGRIVRCGDFITEGPRTPSFDVIVGNPPYLRMLHVPDPLRTEYRQELPDFAIADLLHGFLARCSQVLRAEGELALVTSDRWLFNAGAARLREEIGRHFRLSHVERIDVSSAFYRPKQRRTGTPPRVHPCAVVLSANGAPITREPIYPGWGGAPRKSVRTLGDVAEIRLAPWLGTPGIFLVNHGTAGTLPRESLVPAIDTDDIRGGVLRAPTRYAILTRPDERPPESVIQHLAREMPRMCARGVRTGQPWLPPEPFYRLDLSVPSLLVPRIAKRLTPIRIPAGVLPINHNLSIVRAGELELEELAELLASSDADDWMRLTAAPLENGYRSITTRLLRSMPV